MCFSTGCVLQGGIKSQETFNIFFFFSRFSVFFVFNVDFDWLRSPGGLSRLRRGGGSLKRSYTRPQGRGEMMMMMMTKMMMTMTMMLKMIMMTIMTIMMMNMIMMTMTMMMKRSYTRPQK